MLCHEAGSIGTPESEHTMLLCRDMNCYVRKKINNNLFLKRENGFGFDFLFWIYRLHRVVQLTVKQKLEYSSNVLQYFILSNLGETWVIQNKSNFSKWE